jgi:hypothetical protein
MRPLSAAWLTVTAGTRKMPNERVSERVAERIRKIWALAQRGEAGEKEAALAILEKILSGNGISLEDIVNEDEKEREFKVVLKNDYDERLLVQVYAKVTSQRYIKCYRNRKSFHFFATNSDSIEILSLFSIYKQELQKNFELIFKAFLSKNEIFNMNDQIDDNNLQPELTQEERDGLKKIFHMARLIDRVKLHKMLEGEE